MCTVSIVKNDKNLIITSNRDEKISRKKALEPAQVKLDKKSIYYPKDPEAGGTWIAADSLGNAIVLLNGAFVKHEVVPNYRLSRGIIVLQLISSDAIFLEWNRIDLTDVEPFTLIVFEFGKLAECRWDGSSKHYKELDIVENHIYSSSTLYNQEITNMRKSWFIDFMSISIVNKENLFRFHSQTAPEDKTNGLLINRNNILITQSITQIVIGEKNGLLSYHDLIENKTSNLSYNL
jgi:hypothetical protein